jgi:hypothetical protein
MLDQDRIHDDVRRRYAEAARVATAARSESAESSSCCGPDGSTPVFGDLLYQAADDR